jgi:hypothetical protein
VLYESALAVIIVATIILQIINLNNTISVQIMNDKRVSRNISMNISWLSLSGQSLSVLMVNIAAFVPLIVVVILETAARGTTLFVPFAIILFIATDFSISWWHACTSSIYLATVKQAKPASLSKL